VLVKKIMIKKICFLALVVWTILCAGLAVVFWYELNKDSVAIKDLVATYGTTVEIVMHGHGMAYLVVFIMWVGGVVGIFLVCRKLAGLYRSLEAKITENERLNNRVAELARSMEEKAEVD